MNRLVIPVRHARNLFQAMGCYSQFRSEHPGWPHQLRLRPQAMMDDKAAMEALSQDAAEMPALAHGVQVVPRDPSAQEYWLVVAVQEDGDDQEFEYACMVAGRAAE